MTTAHDIFWLARRAHNTLTDLLREAKAEGFEHVEYKIELSFFGQSPYLCLWIYNNDDALKILAYGISIRDEEGVNRVIAEFRGKLQTLSTEAAAA